MEIKKVLIGIYVDDSDDEALPNRYFLPVGSKRLLDHVVIACEKAAKYTNRYTHKKSYNVNWALLVPSSDESIKKGFASSYAPLIEGPSNLIQRFKQAAELGNADFICKVRSDCPLIPPYLISKHISLALQSDYDYVSNCDDMCKLIPTGLEIEVVKKSLLDWLAVQDFKYEMSHFSGYLKLKKPSWIKMGLTAQYFDLSHLKYSVENLDDLERVREQYRRVGKALYQAETVYEKTSIHRF